MKELTLVGTVENGEGYIVGCKTDDSDKVYGVNIGQCHASIPKRMLGIAGRIKIDTPDANVAVGKTSLDWLTRARAIAATIERNLLIRLPSLVAERSEEGKGLNLRCSWPKQFNMTR